MIEGVGRGVAKGVGAGVKGVGAGLSIGAQGVKGVAKGVQDVGVLGAKGVAKGAKNVASVGVGVAKGVQGVGAGVVQGVGVGVGAGVRVAQNVVQNVQHKARQGGARDDDGLPLMLAQRRMLRQNSRQAWPSRLTARVCKLDLVVECRRLPKKNSFSDADAFCVLWEVPGGYVGGAGGTEQNNRPKVSKLPAKHEKELGRTGVVRGNRNPRFAATFGLEFKFQMEQIYIIRVYDEDLRYATDLKEHDFIGGCIFTLGELMGSPGCAIARPLHGKAFVILVGQEIIETREVLEFRFSGQDLGLLERKHKVVVAKEVLETMEKINVAKNVLEKFNPFFRIEKLNPEDQSWKVVWKSEVVKDNQNPTWNVARLPLQLLCDDEVSNPIKISIWVWNRFTPDEFVGFCESSVKDLVRESKRGIPIFDVMLERRKIFGILGGKKLKKAGSLKVLKAKVLNIPSMLQYFAGGCEMDLMLAIDCSLTNGLWFEERSLHYRGSSWLNDYQAVIKKIGTLYEVYEGKRDFIMWGYGAKLKGDYHTHFPIGEHLKDAEALLKAYDATFSEDNTSLDMFKTAEIKPVVQAAMYRAIRNSKAKQCYSTLVILSTGEVMDLQEAIDAVCAAAEDAPLSIVIIGIGNGNFDRIQLLAGGDAGGKLRNANGVVIAREMVSFVALNNVHGNVSDCVAEALREIPEQFVRHFVDAGTNPLPPKPVPDFTRDALHSKAKLKNGVAKTSKPGSPKRHRQ